MQYMLVFAPHDPEIVKTLSEMGTVVACVVDFDEKLPGDKVASEATCKTVDLMAHNVAAEATRRPQKSSGMTMTLVDQG